MVVEISQPKIVKIRPKRKVSKYDCFIIYKIEYLCWKFQSNFDV